MILRSTNGGAARAALALLVLPAACNDAREAAPTAAPAATAPGPSAAAAGASASASAEPPPAPPPPRWAGTWSGKYRAEKATPTLDPTVVVKSWKKDDGATATGEGTLQVTVGEGGAVRGEVGPPLGPADVRGVVEDDRLRASIVPRDGAERAFRGTLEGDVEGDALVVTIRASDGAAVTVRRGEGKLAR
jgi:hypothetical protein